MEIDEEELTETVDYPHSNEFELEKIETAYHVYQDLWTKFYDWDEDFCRQTIGSLSTSDFGWGDLPDDNHDGRTHSRQDDFSEWFVIEDLDQSRASYIRVCTKTILPDQKKFQQYDKYTSCTPTSLNFSGPKNPLWAAAFLPFADNPTFPVKSYLKNFRTFGWQIDHPDPDRKFPSNFLRDIQLIDFLLDELIHLEAARRLHYTYEFTYSDIDKLQIFPVSLRLNHRRGLISSTSQRLAKL